MQATADVVREAEEQRRKALTEKRKLRDQLVGERYKRKVRLAGTAFRGKVWPADPSRAAVGHRSSITRVILPLHHHKARC